MEFIHRDIKLSNILVMIADDQPVPKVIDFGTARATAQLEDARSERCELAVKMET